jgi:hypothetical protein
MTLNTHLSVDRSVRGAETDQHTVLKTIHLPKQDAAAHSIKRFVEQGSGYLRVSAPDMLLQWYYMETCIVCAYPNGTIRFPY